MSRFKTALRIAAAAAFAVPALLGLLSFCTFTFYNGEALAGEFNLSPLQMLIGVDFSGRVISNPLLGASFFLIPLMGLACCLIKNDDTRASVTGVTSLIGFVYIRFVTDKIIPSAIYTKSMEQTFSESFSSNRATYGMTAAGNMMWIFYIIAFVLAMTTFVMFLHEIRVNAQKNYDEEYYAEDETWSEDGESAYFDVVDEINPDYSEDEDYQQYEDYEEETEEDIPESKDINDDEMAHFEAAFAQLDAELAQAANEYSPEDDDVAPQEKSEKETAETAEETYMPNSNTDADLIEEAVTEVENSELNEEPETSANDNEESDFSQNDNAKPPLVITDDVETSAPHETDIVFKKLNFNMKKSNERPRLAVEKATAASEKTTANLCPKCKSELRPGTVFCKKCGNRIDPKE